MRGGTRRVFRSFGGGFSGVGSRVFGGVGRGVGSLGCGVHRLRGIRGGVGAGGMEGGGSAGEKKKRREWGNVVWFGAFHGERRVDLAR
jgi:hypothetical protein